MRRFGHRPDGIVVIGASAGGIPAICTVLEGLPGEFSLPIIVVNHISPTQSALPVVLSRCGRLPAVNPRNGDALKPGRVYVAPPNRHLLVHNDRLEVSSGPLENHFRPAIDPLFRSAARSHGERVIGIILSGALDDGVAGLFAVKSHGGITIVQEPSEATISALPEHACKKVKVDYRLPVSQMADLLVKLQEDLQMPINRKKSQKNKATRKNSADSSLCGTNGTPVPFACPDCHGPLFEVKDGKIVQFHCLVGHAFSPVSLDVAHADALERALWIAIRTLKERNHVQRIVGKNYQTSLGKDRKKRIVEQIAANERDIDLLEEIHGRL